MKIELRENEMVIKATDAKYFNNQTVDGKLILTNQGIYFNCDDQDHNINIPYPAISEAMPYKTGIFSNNGLTVVKSSGKTYKFSVKKRNKICVLLNSKL